MADIEAPFGAAEQAARYYDGHYTSTFPLGSLALGRMRVPPIACNIRDEDLNSLPEQLVAGLRQYAGALGVDLATVETTRGLGSFNGNLGAYYHHLEGKIDCAWYDQSQRQYSYDDDPGPYESDDFQLDAKGHLVPKGYE